MADWVQATVVRVTHFTDHLFSLTIQAPVAPFVAGQFTKLAMQINGKRVARAYSYVNAPNSSNTEFYIVKVEKGKLSPYLHNLKIGDSLMVARDASGHFTLKEVPRSEILWLIATGTGVAPYLSILQQGEDLSKFNDIVLVHAVRYQKELSYLPLMNKLNQHVASRLHIQPIVSRQQVTGALYGRIPALIENGSLEKRVGLPINAQQSHVMLCGNPGMIADTQTILKGKKQMSRNLRRAPGHFTSELYW